MADSSNKPNEKTKRSPTLQKLYEVAKRRAMLERARENSIKSAENMRKPK